MHAIGICVHDGLDNNGNTGIEQVQFAKKSFTFR